MKLGEKGILFLNLIISSNFSFINYPFILTPETKFTLLALESRINQIIKYRQVYLLTRTYFQSQFSASMPILLIDIRREYLLEDSLDKINLISMEMKENFQCPLKVKFIGEEGVDEGGVRKEWFQLLTAKLFNLDYGMFIERSFKFLLFFN